MMTWTSERSGRASTGVWATAQAPHSDSPLAASPSRNGFLALHSMIRSIIASPRLHPGHVFHAAPIPAHLGLLHPDAAHAERTHHVGRGHQLALGIDEKGPRRDHLVAGL